MIHRGLKLISAILLVFSFSVQSFAQAQALPPEAGTERGKAPTGGPRKQLATIIFAGLGGAILGLSTLSFYGRPQEKLSNIAIGFAFGVISGTAFVTYKAATNPAEFYGTASRYEPLMEGGEGILVQRDQIELPAKQFNLAFTF